MQFWTFNVVFQGENFQYLMFSFFSLRHTQQIKFLRWKETCLSNGFTSGFMNGSAIIICSFLMKMIIEMILINPMIPKHRSENKNVQLGYMCFLSLVSRWIHRVNKTKLFVSHVVFLGYLFFTAFFTHKMRTNTFTEINPSIFNELYEKSHETLLCPCKNFNIPYHTFVSHSITSHPVCSSEFVTREWIESLYLPMRSTYFVPDFRTTAISQVKQNVTLE